MEFEICQSCSPKSLTLPEGLPTNVRYLLCENNPSDEGASSVVLRSVGTTEEDARNWLKDYSLESRTTWRVQCAHPESGRKNVFKTEYRCQHNTRHKRSGQAKRKPSVILKNTECPAKLTILVKRVPKRSRSLDKHLPHYPMVVHLKNGHNHSPDCAAALRHRDVSAEVRAKFEMFYKEQRHSPGSALATHLHDLHQDHGENIFQALSDRALCPDRGWCYSLYYKVFNKDYKEKCVENKLDAFHEVLQEYNKLMGQECSRLLCLDSNEFACAIITPLMHRNHQLNYQSGEMCYIDSSGKTDRDKNSVRMYLMLTDSEAGGIPLALLIVSSESERVLYEACMLYRSMLDDRMHYGRGNTGPQVFMTEDCPTLRNTLSAVFPGSALLLNTLHLIQASWKYLCNQGNGVPSPKRTEMMHIVKRLLFSNTKEELESVYFDIESNSELTHQYTRFQEYLRQIYGRKDLWAPCNFRTGLIVRGHNTTNVCEAAMRVMKDVLLHRLRSYNLPQMAHFIFTRLDEYYGRRLQDVVNDKENHATKRRFLVGKSLLPAENITQLSPVHYRVCDGKLVHEVDISVATCTCVAGTTTGAPCKHQFAVAWHLGVHTLLNVPSHGTNYSTTGKITLYEIATGKRVDIPDNWFEQPLQSSPEPQQALSNADMQKVDEESASNNHQAIDISDEENQESSDTHETLHKFSLVYSKLKDKFLKDPNIYGPALNKFCDTIESMPNDSSIVTALSHCGKYVSSVGPNKECTLEIPISDWFN